MSSAVGDASRSLDELIAMLKKLRPGELSERQHEILESKAVYAVSTLRSAFNTASPVHKLPLEVLGLIFSELVWQMVPPEGFIPDLLQVRRRMPQPIHTTSMVSRRWREVALSFPGLWSTVCTCENERMVHIIERSKNTLLRIFVSSIPLRTPDFYQSPSPVTRLLIPTIDTIAPHSNRVQELHLLDISIEELNETSLIQSLLPNLECLTLVMDGDQQLFPLSILANDTPLLKKVTFIHCPFFAAANLRGLTHLCIMSAESLSHVGQIVDVLQALPDLEEFCLAQVRLEHDSTSLHHNKVVLERLRVIGLGAWSRTFPVSDFLQRLLLPSNVELLIWDAHINLTSLALHTLVPAFIAPKELIKELRLTAPRNRRIPRRISRSAIPSLRAPKLCTVVSNPSAFQLDGCFIAGAALLSQVSDSLDLSHVRELWLGQKYDEEPSFDEWRSFFISVPALDTLVIVHRPSHPVISALTVSKDDASGILPCTNLRTIRILDRSLSLVRLSLFVEQRNSMGFRLNLCEILSSSLPTQPPLNSVNGEPHYDDRSIQSEAIVTDLAALKDYVDDVVYSARLFPRFWDVLPSPVFDWLRRIWGESCVSVYDS